MDTLTLVNGNHQKYTIGLPKIHILDKYINDVALAHIEENTGIKFLTDTWSGYVGQPTEHWQISALFLTYNYKTQYHNNASEKNTLFLKSDHHTGFHVDSICYECVKHNHINVNGLEPHSRLSC